MALRPCSECGKEISTEARQCPHCGAKPSNGIGCLGWIMAFLLFSFVVTAVSRLKGGDDHASGISSDNMNKIYGLSALKLENYRWQKGGFNNIMIAQFTLRNTGKRTLKDVEITCYSYGHSGTQIDRNVRTIYEQIPPGKTKRVRDFNMGLQHTQASSASCEVTDLVAL